MWTFPQSSSEMIHQSNQNPPIFYTIDEHTLTQQWDKHSKDPFPIYTVIDKQCKQENEDPWFEITPHEAGYSLIGASVGVSKFGSQFEKGSMKKKQPEIDMLYLQALCGSAVADGEENRILLWKNIKDFFSWFRKHTLNEMGKEDPDSASVDKCFQVLLDLVDMNLCVLDGGDPSAHDESIRTTLTDINPEKHMFFPPGILDIHSKKTLKNYTIDVCINLDGCSHFWPIDICLSICKCMAQWIWGRKYNFLHNMKDEAVPAALLKSEKRDYEDAGLLLNSPYVSVLREERNINLIISLDFSDGDPFMTVKEAAKMCKERNIPFPKVNIPSEDLQKPKDFYVFKGQNAPTVIHIPLFNVVNCGDKIEDWRSKYGTFQGSYSAEMITDLMEVAGKNITNNKAKMVEEVRAIVGLQA